MKRPYSFFFGISLLLFFYWTSFASVTPSDNPELNSSQQIKEKIEGTYRFLQRILPDGTVLSPPRSQGTLTFINGERNLELQIKNAEEKVFAVSSKSIYTIEDGLFVEKNVFFILKDEISSGSEIKDFSDVNGISPINEEENQISFLLPLHNEPALVFKGNRLTATKGGEFIDTWEKVAE